MSGAICSGADNYYFRLPATQFLQFSFPDLMAAEHEKATFPLSHRAIHKNDNVCAVFPALDYYRAKGKSIYLSHEP